jgi:enoyl-CoA hydratase
MAETRLRLEERNEIHHLIMDRGANALDRQLIDELRAALARRADRGGDPVLLRSTHPTIFSPGWDLKRLAASQREEVHTFLAAFNRLIYELFSYPGPTAAMINGHAVAGGLLMAMACDVRVMASGPARLGLAEVNLGVPVPGGSVRMLLARLAPWVVEELIFGGDGCTAERARELGLVQRLAAPASLERVTLQEFHSLVAKPRSAVNRSKVFLFERVWGEMEDAGPAEDEAFLDCWFEDSTQERIQATARRLSH